MVVVAVVLCVCVCLPVCVSEREGENEFLGGEEGEGPEMQMFYLSQDHPLANGSACS